MTRARAASRTEVGLARDRNEDAMHADVERGIYAVADGVGGRGHGEVASALACQAVAIAAREGLASLRRPCSPAELANVARHAVERACQAVHVEARPGAKHAGAATTLTLLLIDGSHAAMAHVGDSRLYLLRKGKLEQLSIDHTVAHELYRAGHIGPEEARRHAFRHVLSRSLGPHRSVVVDTLPLALAAGDLLLLTTDGLNDVVDEVDLMEELAGEELEVGVERLTQRSLELGGKDNATVVAVRIADVSQDSRALAVELLAKVEPFAALSLASRSRVIGSGSVETYPAGATVLRKGEGLAGLWMVVEGEARSGARRVLAPGDWLGEGALVRDEVATADVRVDAPARIFHLPARSWRRLARRRPVLAVSVLTRLAASALAR